MAIFNIIRITGCQRNSAADARLKCMVSAWWRLEKGNAILGNADFK